MSNEQIEEEWARVKEVRKQAEEELDEIRKLRAELERDKKRRAERGVSGHEVEDGEIVESCDEGDTEVRGLGNTPSGSLPKASSGRRGRERDEIYKWSNRRRYIAGNCWKSGSKSCEKEGASGSGGSERGRSESRDGGTGGSVKGRSERVESGEKNRVERRTGGQGKGGGKDDRGKDDGGKDGGGKGGGGKGGGGKGGGGKGGGGKGGRGKGGGGKGGGTHFYINFNTK